jgi:hypothetical protein
MTSVPPTDGDARTAIETARRFVTEVARFIDSPTPDLSGH